MFIPFFLKEHGWPAAENMAARRAGAVVVVD